MIRGWWIISMLVGVLAVANALAAEKATPPAKTQTITFDNLKLDLKKGDPYKATLLTEEIKKLDGKRVRVRGFMLPGYQQSGIVDFVLVRDNLECCFGPGALIFDCIKVKMVNDHPIEFNRSPVTVEGTFMLKELQGPENEPLAIYQMSATSVK